MTTTCTLCLKVITPQEVADGNLTETPVECCGDGPDAQPYMYKGYLLEPGGYFIHYHCHVKRMKRQLRRRQSATCPRCDVPCTEEYLDKYSALRFRKFLITYPDKLRNATDATDAEL